MLSEVISELEASTEMLSELSDYHEIDQKIEEAEAQFSSMRIIVKGFLEEPLAQEEAPWGLDIYRLGFCYQTDPYFKAGALGACYQTERGSEAGARGRGGQRNTHS
jgi:hypothetical protein